MPPFAKIGNKGSRVRHKSGFMLLLFLLLAVPVFAQSDDNPTVLDINYDDIVHDTLTSNAFYDWWTIEASTGDDLVIDMAASDGLEPLIGILNGSGDLVAKSEDGAPDATITLEYVIPEGGHYTIVATRVGNINGTSTGSYSLRLRRANSPVTSINPYQDVTFRCKDASYEVTTAATISFEEDPAAGLGHRITVYGLDGFRPVIRLNFDASTAEPFEVCNTDAEFTIGDTYTLPGQDTQTVTKDTQGNVSQLLVTNADKMGLLTVTIGSQDGLPGRYIAVFEGFAIEPKDDIDYMDVRIGPLAAKTTSMTAYMIAGENSRLDPFLSTVDKSQSCDDAGRGDCSSIPSLVGVGVTLHNGDSGTISYIGDRSDAGLVLTPLNPDAVGLQMTSHSQDTHGPYAIILIGELPPRAP